MPLQGKSIVHEINRVLRDYTILVKENGGQDLWAYYQVLDPGCCVPPTAQMAMVCSIIRGDVEDHEPITGTSIGQ
jgi:hypothetical protein